MNLAWKKIEAGFVAVPALDEAAAQVLLYSYSASWHAQVHRPDGSNAITFFRTVEEAQAWCEQQLAALRR